VTAEGRRQLLVGLSRRQLGP